MPAEDIRETVSDFVYDLLDAGERRQVEEKIKSDAAWRRAYEEAVRERGLLARWAAPEPPAGLAEATIAAARSTRKPRKGHAMSYEPVEPEVRWLGSRGFWRIAAVVAIVLVGGLIFQWRRVSSLRAGPQEAFVYGQPELTPGLPASYRVFVRNGARGVPIANARVAARLVDGEGRAVWTGEATTDGDGMADVAPDLPDDAPDGDYTLAVDARSADGRSTVSRGVAVTRSFRVLVSCDKPLYQPGQTMHLRTLALATADLRPVGGRELVLEVRDAKGNKVFKKPTKTSDFGIAAADFQLADQVNVGSYTLSATMGDTTSERTVRVERYRLPKFKIELSTDKGYYEPGKTLAGDLTAVYTFGEPVRKGAVRIVASEFVEKLRPFATVDGETDDEGRFHFELKLKEDFAGTELRKGDAAVTLRATVIDTAGHKQQKLLERAVTTRPIRIELFPESGTLVAGVENLVYIVTAYPDGRPAKTTLTLMTRDSERAVATSDLGIATVRVTPRGERMAVSVVAVDDKGLRAEATRTIPVGARSESLLLRSDKAVYEAGETAKLTVLSADRKGRIFVDVVKDRRSVLTTTLDVTEGRGELALDLPPDLFGTLELHAYRIMANGNMVRDARLIQVRRADALTIAAKLDKATYRPAEKALVSFIVTRSDGQPAQAALSLAGVDEAVFALSQMRPGLERVYFAIQEEILKPRYEIHAHAPMSPAQLIEPEPRPEARDAANVLLAAAEPPSAPSSDASETFREKARRVRQERREGEGNVKAAAALIPFAVYMVLLLPCAVYVVVKLVRRAPLDSASEADLLKLRSATVAVGHWWVLGFYLAFVGGLIGALAARWYWAGQGAVMGGLLMAMVSFGVLIYATMRLRQCAASAAFPLLRKAAGTLPVAYVFAAVSVCTIAAAASSGRGFFRHDEVTVLFILALCGAALVVPAAMALAAGCADKLVSTARCIWLGISRPLLAAVPALLLAMFLPALARAREEGPGLAMPMAKAEWMGGELDATLDSGITDSAAGDISKDVSDLRTPGSPPTPATVRAAGLQAPKRIRRYFPETLLWRPELITDAGGRAQLEIPLADSITTWRLAMSAVSARGELGAATKGIRVFQDFFVDVDFPVALTQHDVVSVPITVYNYLDREQTVRLDVQKESWFELLDEASKTLEVPPKRPTSVYFRLEAKTPGRHALTVKAHGTELADAVRRKVIVEPDGKAVVQTINGRLSENLSRELAIPAAAIDGANDLIVKIYPGSFSQVVEGLDSIFRMPYGCFEQTSSATYPNVLVLDYMRTTSQLKPELEMKARNFINLGCQRLLSYEVKGGGFEWFGHEPADTVLTAYGLMEFSDMAKVHDVDPAVIERTRRWLFGQQRNDGSWEPTQGGIAEGAINAFQGAALRTTAYVAWAIAEAGGADPRLDRALDYIARHSGDTEDAYTLALCANALVAAERPEATKPLGGLNAMKVVEDKLVHWTSKGQGATFSRGNVLDIETTALAAYALIKARHTDKAHQALAWLIEQKDPNGTWHSTQATVHAMRALLAGAGPSGEVEGDVHVTVAANGTLAKELTITPRTSDVFRLISLRHAVRKGTNTVALETAGKGNLAYQIVATHYLPWPEQRPAAPKELSIDVAYDTTTLKTNDLLTCRVTLRYNRPGSANMTIVDLGVPPGFEVLPGAFEKLRTEGVIERYAPTGRQVILYFRSIPGGKDVVFSYQLRAKFPVKAKTPRSTVYQYYEPDVRDEAPPVVLKVL